VSGKETSTSSSDKKKEVTSGEKSSLGHLELVAREGEKRNGPQKLTRLERRKGEGGGDGISDRPQQKEKVDGLSL